MELPAASCGGITENKEGKIITYKITTEGENVPEIAKQQFCKTFKDVL